VREFPDQLPAGDRDFGGAAPLGGLAPLADAYDGFIIDQWGVLHDGTRAYPGAISCLTRLRAAGKRIVVLSNSGRRAAVGIQLMAEIGFDRELYDRFVSAGEDARCALAARAGAFHRKLGRRCYAFTRGGDRSLLEGMALDLVERVDDADFLAVIGIDSPQRCLSDYEAELQAGAARGLPMVCANPDLVRVAPEGTVEAPGTLARRYEALGGEVFYHGKPHLPIYGSCLEALGGCAPERVLAVGDSIEHDILGAARARIRSAFITGGIHAAELGVAWGELPASAAWRRFAANAVAHPDYILPAFVW